MLRQAERFLKAACSKPSSVRESLAALASRGAQLTHVFCACRAQDMKLTDAEIAVYLKFWAKERAKVRRSSRSSLFRGMGMGLFTTAATLVHRR